MRMKTEPNERETQRGVFLSSSSTIYTSKMKTKIEIHSEFVSLAAAAEKYAAMAWYM